MKKRMSTIKSYFCLTVCVLLNTSLISALENYNNLNLSLGPAWGHYLGDLGFNITDDQALLDELGIPDPAGARERQIVKTEELVYPAIGIDARLSFLNCFTVNLTSTLGWFRHGREITRGIAPYPSTSIINSFISGHSYRVNAGAGLWLSYDNSCWALNPQVGYAYREQLFCICTPEQAPAVPEASAGTSKRCVKWRGPFIGLDSICIVRDDITFSASYALTFAEYKLNSVGSTGASSSGCISNALGNYFKIASFYNISPCFDVGLGVWYENLQSRCGKSRFNEPSPILTNSDLLDARWQEGGVQFSVGYSY